MPDARYEPIATVGPSSSVSPHLGSAIASFPPGQIHRMRRLVAPTVAAVLVDYERDDSVHGTWYSEHLHFFDMTLSRRPAGAKGSFAEARRDARPVGPVLFAPSGFHYRGEGGRGRQKSISLFLEDASDEAFRPAIATSLAECVSLQSRAVRDLLHRIAREVEDPGFASELLLEGMALSLLAETARALRGDRDRGFRAGGLATADIRVIEERVTTGGRPPSLAELATLCGTSRRQLIRAFRAETGETIGAYVRKTLMERARRMLAETDMSIGEIGSAIGFARAAAFSAAFRRACGRTPRDYRAGVRRRCFVSTIGFAGTTTNKFGTNRKFLR